MKYLLVDLLLAALYVVVLALGVFDFISILLTSALLFVLLLVTIIYKFAVYAKPESMGGEFVEREKRREERIRRRAVIGRMTGIIDAMIQNIYNLRLLIRNKIYVLDVEFYEPMKQDLNLRKLYAVGRVIKIVNSMIENVRKLRVLFRKNLFYVLDTSQKN